MVCFRIESGRRQHLTALYVHQCCLVQPELFAWSVKLIECGANTQLLAVSPLFLC